MSSDTNRADPATRVLVVDDEPRMVKAIGQALRRAGHEVLEETRPSEALAAFERAQSGERIDVVVTDWKMPGLDGLALMAALHTRAPGLPVILVTAHGDVPSAVEAIRRGAFDYLVKPFDNDELRAIVARALELRRLRAENARLRAALDAESAVIAEAPAMREALALVDRVAGSDAPVLITGESGTGKELVARRLHAGSARVGAPFVAVNCKAFAPGVLESELFGHAKGAFTGATTARRGCFERADGGTLFLDEIGEVEPEFQAKLLRVLQEGEVLPVGAEAARPVDVRIVAATHRDLPAAIEAGAFREDLFFRLNVIPVRLPPLRERPEDVLVLARHFLTRYAQGRELRFGPEAEARLQGHPWPGNVRELENTVQRAAILARDDTVAAADFLLEASTAAVARPGGEGTLQEAMDAAAAARIRAALAASDGRRVEAAQALGIDRSTLYRLMRRLGIET